MRAKTVKESDNRLKVYKNREGNYDAIQNSFLYSFMWSPITYKVYNFKKIGRIGEDFKPMGKLVMDPHIQMILQFQIKISSFNESINFERGKNPKKSMDIGIIQQNMDPNKRVENFKISHPEVQIAYTGSSHLIAPGKHPHWQLLNFSLKKSHKSKDLKKDEKRYKKWFQDYTNFEIIEIKSSERKWHPWGDKSKEEILDQDFQIKMRMEDDIS